MATAPPVYAHSPHTHLPLARTNRPPSPLQFPAWGIPGNAGLIFDLEIMKIQ